MDILVLQGSPVKNGSTSILIDYFIRGAQAAGNKCQVIETDRVDVGTCSGCVACGYEGDCIQDDDMLRIRQEILNSNMLVFATPLYYYGMTAQLKTVIDRFCAFNSSLTSRHLKSALLAVAWNSDKWTFEALMSHYQTLVRYLNFEDMGVVLGYGCGTPTMTQRSRYPQEAENLGLSLSR